MISKNELETLIGREGNPGHPVLSVYLDVDQSREFNLNRRFEVSLNNLLRELERGIVDQFEREEFIVDAERVSRFMSGYRPGARSLAIFCDGLEDFFWHRELNVPLRSESRWSETLYLRPLLETLDEYERYGVILADRAQARLFTVYLDEIEEQGESFAQGEVKIFKAPGKDRILSDMRFQRKADQFAYLHLKRVAELTVELAGRHTFDRLLLAGPVEARAQLQQLLPKQLQERVIGLLDLPVDADRHTVLAATRQIREEAERKDEVMLVEQLISDAARAEQRAVTGLGAAIRALRQERIWQLVYAEGFAPSGSRCINCATLFDETLELCPYCDASVRPVDDLVEQAAQRVIVSGGKVEQVRGAIVERLREVGSIGAFLKF